MASPDEPTVYVVHQPEDAEFAASFAKVLSESQIEPILPAFEGDPAELRAQHEQTLRECDAVAVCWGVASELWVKSTFQRLRYWYDLGREKPLKFLAAALGPPRTAAKEIFAEIWPRDKGELIWNLSDREKLAPGDLDALVTAMSGRTVNPPASASAMRYDVAPERDDEAPAEDSKQIDRADFCVFAPPAVAPSTEFVLSVWAFLRERRAQMVELATVAGAAPRGWLGPLRVERDIELSLVLQLRGFTIEHPVGTMLWDGEIANTSFLIAAPPNLSPRTYPGAVTILQGDVPLGRLLFEIAVETAQSKEATYIEAQFKRITNAFASYASEDRAEVLSRVQGIRAAGVNVFLDVLSLRAGEDWEKNITTEIDRCDALYLFWSDAARKSRWVDHEWHLALRKRGPEFIWPVPLADPRDVPPPRELASAHFNDAILLLLNAERARRNET